MKEIRIGVVGIGHLGSYHLKKYQQIEGCRIVGVADTLPDRAREAAECYGCQAFTDLSRMAEKIDAVSIAVPTAAHYEVASLFLDAGVDVLLEKPITVTLTEADKLLALAREKSLILQVGLVERFNPAVVALHRVIGHPLFIESHRLHPFFERGTDVDVILDLMIHDLDIILHFVRSPVETLDAVGISVLSDKVDIANARLTFQSGCVANITASRVTAKTLQKIRFFGIEGYHAVNYQKKELVSLGRKQGPDGQIVIAPNPVEISTQDALEAEIRAFVHSVTHRTAPAVSGQEGRDALSLAIKINEAIQKNRKRSPLPILPLTDTPLTETSSAATGQFPL